MPSQRFNKEEQRHLKSFLLSRMPEIMPHAASFGLFGEEASRLLAGNLGELGVWHVNRAGKQLKGGLLG